MINSRWKILQCCLFWAGLIRRMWPYSDTNHFSFCSQGREAGLLLYTQPRSAVPWPLGTGAQNTHVRMLSRVLVQNDNEKKMVPAVQLHTSSITLMLVMNVARVAFWCEGKKWFWWGKYKTSHTADIYHQGEWPPRKRAHATHSNAHVIVYIDHAQRVAHSLNLFCCKNAFGLCRAQTKETRNPHNTMSCVHHPTKTQKRKGAFQAKTLDWR